MEFFIITAQVLPIIDFVPFSFIVVNALTEVEALPFAEFRVKRVDCLDSHLAVIAIHVGFPRIDVDVNLRGKELSWVEV